jgi:hypothetical protein
MLENQDIALRPLDDGLFEVFFGPLLLGWFDASSGLTKGVHPGYSSPAQR